MKLSRWIRAIFTAGAILSGSFTFAQDHVFTRPGISFQQDVSIKSEQTVTLSGQELTQSWESLYRCKWSILPPKGDDLHVKLAFPILQWNTKFADNVLSFDSTDKHSPHSTFSQYRFMASNDFALTIDKKTMSVKKVEAIGGFGDLHASLHKQTLDFVRESAERVFVELPPASVAAGTVWNKDSSSSSFEAKYRFVVEAVNGKTAKLKFDATVELKKSSDLSLTIKSAEWNSSKWSGTALYDIEKGRIQSSVSDGALTGTVCLEIGGNDVAAKFSCKEQRSIKTLKKEMPASTVAPQTAASLIAFGASPTSGAIQQLVGVWADPPPIILGLGGIRRYLRDPVVYYYEIE